MRIDVLLSVLMCSAIAMAGGQPPEIRKLAARIVPKVRLVDDAAFFAAWNLDYPGMEQVKAAVEARDYAKAKGALKEYFLQRRKPEWKINHWNMPKKPKGKPEQHSRFKQGEDILAHKFSGGGHEVEFGEKIDWNYFPLKLANGRPDTEYPVIHYLNRFGHFSRILGPLYWYSHDERYAKEFVYEVTSHVASIPAPEKYIRYTAVWSKLTSIVPLCGSWLDGYNYFLPSKSFTPEAHAIMLKGFIEKARYAVRNPDAVNRYMIQLRGIYNCGAYFPELKQAKDFRDFAALAMTKTVDDEFYPDCISKELCPGYHGGSNGAVRSIIESARLMGYEAPEKLLKGVESGYDFYPKVATPLRGIPQFGDSWGMPDLSKTFSSALNFIDKPVYRWFATKGKEGEPPAFISTRLPWAGFYVMRSGWDERALYLCMDAGPLGLGHWHEDFNNFECYAYGERLISEVGIYSYTQNKWRAYFYSSLAHNLVVVDGLSQNRACERKKYASTDTPRENDWHSDGVFDLAYGVYDGLWADLSNPQGRWNRFDKDQASPLATHRRDICFVKDSYWIISDRLTADGEHTYSQLFHFQPDRTVKVLGKDRAGTVDADRANVILVQADPIPARVIKGQEDPLQGWFSREHGKKEPAPMLSFDQKTTGGAIYDTVVLPLDVGQKAEITVERLSVTDDAGAVIPPADVCALRITTPTGRDIYLNDLRQEEIGPANGKIKRAGDIEIDARAAVLRFDKEGGLVKCSAVGGTFLKLWGRTIWERKE
ncbi:MAG: hypothetical protein GXP25_20635 [Planctomycetes bacterium]|nr:hypothetical protein [Planctomycetota bacterium]